MKIIKLIYKIDKIKDYKKFQVKGSIICIMGLFIYCFLITRNSGFNGIWVRYEFYIALIVLLIYNVVLEKIIEPLEKERKKLIESIIYRMILKICNCNSSCECKEKLNEYMKEKKIKII